MLLRKRGFVFEDSKRKKKEKKRNEEKIPEILEVSYDDDDRSSTMSTTWPSLTSDRSRCNQQRQVMKR